ncbi:MFS general substrate transporter [Phanerochaete sordida]|uniref:MFS general substrate transporter n=1 Tax=Phanerochaete sordida TaxID=48140 RepID=A0A9P3GEL7_9APHY|nr:MFS general substrate transporter [Phanerochaete sordida]
MEDPAASTSFRKKGKGAAFWLSFIAIIAAVFLSALDLTAVSTALPTITQDLHGDSDFVWVGSAYALSSTAFLPLSGALADIFGRKPVMLGSIFLFALGSALAGAAQNMNWLIAARTVQGIGGGGILNLTEIITSDLVPLAERGLYQGILGLTWSFASGVGPPIGGSFAQKASWRWLFFLNLPLTGIAFVLVWIFLAVRTPEGSVRAKLARVDWFGNLIVIAGSTLAIVGLTFGGIRFPWDSAQVLAPLIIGLALIVVFLIYEGKVPKEPTIPWEVLSNRTTIGGYLATLIHGIVSISIIYYLPVYFQAVLGASPIRSGVDMLATALLIAPFAFVAGVLVQVMKKYRPANLLGWVLTIAGFGVLSLLRADEPVARWVGYQILAAVGTGMIFAATIFPVLSPLPVSRTAPALAFFAFVRAFAQTWGITIASTALQNALKRRLPPAFLARFPGGLEIAFAAIPLINGLDEPLRGEVRVAFAESMRVIWLVMLGISGAGLLTVALLEEVPMKEMTDERYALEEKARTGDAEGAEKTVVEKEGAVEEKREQSPDALSEPVVRSSFIAEAEEGMHL